MGVQQLLLEGGEVGDVVQERARGGGGGGGGGAVGHAARDPEQRVTGTGDHLE